MIAVAGEPKSRQYRTFSGKHIGHIRRKYSRLRKNLMKAKKIKAVKKLNDKERRIIHYWNHVISKQIVEFAVSCGASVIKLEDLSTIRSMRTYWKRSDRNIHSWAFYDLEQKIPHKAPDCAVYLADDVLPGFPMKCGTEPR